MTINLYITSTQSFSGKSALCVALMHRLRKDGYRVGYLKPFSSAARVLAESSIDEDARFVKETFNLSEPLEILAPVVITNQRVQNLLADGGVDYRDAVKRAAEVVSHDKDVVLMEGSDSFREGYIVNLSLNEVANLVDAKVITIIGYKNSLQVVDDILTAIDRLQERLFGVIINTVPESRLAYIHELVIPYAQKRGANLLAVLPYQETLHSISIGDINQALGGELRCATCEEDLVENLTVAAMNVEQAFKHFREIKNKAVIVGGDRPDIQLAALETSTKALIFTGHACPNPMIEAKAVELGVAIILSPHDTLTTVEKVDRFFGKTRFHQAEKVTRFELLLNNTMDFAEFYRKLGLR
jgi:hypothetical protein